MTGYLKSCFVCKIASRNPLSNFSKLTHFLQDFAILDYRANMRLDNLPVAEIATFAYDDKVGANFACLASSLLHRLLRLVHRNFLVSEITTFRRVIFFFFS